MTNKTPRHETSTTEQHYPWNSATTQCPDSKLAPRTLPDIAVGR